MRLTHWLIWGAVTTAATLSWGAASAQERARVLQSVQVVQQVSVPQQVCDDAPIHADRPMQVYPGSQPMRRCVNTTRYENRTVGWDVSYEYAGRRYTTRMDHDPGRWVLVQAQPTGNYDSTGLQGGAISPGVYGSTPPGMTVTESISYDTPMPNMPIVINVDPRYPYPYYPPRPQPRTRP